MLFELEGTPIPLALCGLDLLSSGEPMADDPLEYEEGSSLTFGLHLAPMGVIPPESRVRVEIEGAGPRLSKEYPLTITGGRTGVRMVQQLPFAHGRGIVNGDATLRISYRSNAGESRSETLYTVPIHIKPSATRSTIADGALQQAFGPRFVRLNASFRLGRNSAIRLTVPKEIPWSVQALGLISATAYDPNPRRGQVVCRISCTNSSGTVTEGTVKHGITTAKTDHDYYADGTLDTVKIAVFSTSPAPRPAADGSSFNTYLYSSVVPLSEPLKPTDITLRSVAPAGVLDVKEIVLLPSHVGVTR